jgi:hypothetical protein
LKLIGIKMRTSTMLTAARTIETFPAYSELWTVFFCFSFNTLWMPSWIEPSPFSIMKYKSCWISFTVEFWRNWSFQSNDIFGIIVFEGIPIDPLL